MAPSTRGQRRGQNPRQPDATAIGWAISGEIELFDAADVVLTGTYEERVGWTLVGSPPGPIDLDFARLTKYAGARPNGLPDVPGPAIALESRVTGTKIEVYAGLDLFQSQFGDVDLAYEVKTKMLVGTVVYEGKTVPELDGVGVSFSWSKQTKFRFLGITGFDNLDAGHFLQWGKMLKNAQSGTACAAAVKNLTNELTSKAVTSTVTVTDFKQVPSSKPAADQKPVALKFTVTPTCNLSFTLSPDKKMQVKAAPVTITLDQPGDFKLEHLAGWVVEEVCKNAADAFAKEISRPDKLMPFLLAALGPSMAGTIAANLVCKDDPPPEESGENEADNAEDAADEAADSAGDVAGAAGADAAADAAATAFAAAGVCTGLVALLKGLWDKFTSWLTHKKTPAEKAKEKADAARKKAQDDLNAYLNPIGPVSIRNVADHDLQTGWTRVPGDAEVTYHVQLAGSSGPVAQAALPPSASWTSKKGSWTVPMEDLRRYAATNPGDLDLTLTAWATLDKQVSTTYRDQPKLVSVHGEGSKHVASVHWNSLLVPAAPGPITASWRLADNRLALDCAHEADAAGGYSFEVAILMPGQTPNKPIRRVVATKHVAQPAPPQKPRWATTGPAPLAPRPSCEVDPRRFLPNIGGTVQVSARAIGPASVLISEPAVAVNDLVRLRSTTAQAAYDGPTNVLTVSWAAVIDADAYTVELMDPAIQGTPLATNHVTEATAGSHADHSTTTFNLGQIARPNGADALLASVTPTGNGLIDGPTALTPTVTITDPQILFRVGSRISSR